MSIKAVIVADSHGAYACLDAIISAEAPFDYLIHCGDGISDLSRASIPAGVTVLKVCGNIDDRDVHICEEELIQEIHPHKFLIIHGHQLGAKSGLSGILSRGALENVTAVFFGHTHQQVMTRRENILLFNPGPACEGYYGVMHSSIGVVIEQKKINC